MTKWIEIIGMVLLGIPALFIAGLIIVATFTVIYDDIQVNGFDLFHALIIAGCIGAGCLVWAHNRKNR